MRKTDIFLAHPEQKKAELLCRRVSSETGLAASFASSFTEAAAFLENMENVPGIALITPLPSGGAAKYALLEKAMERGIPTIALFNNTAQKNAIPAAISGQPYFIGAFDIRRNTDALVVKILCLWRNRYMKTLLWADSASDLGELHIELQRCLFKVHSTTEAASLVSILGKNPDVSLLVLAAKNAPQPLLNALTTARSRFPRTTLSIICLTGEQLASYVPDILENGADLCLPLLFSRPELRALCTNHAGMISHMRSLSTRNNQKSRLGIAMVEDLRKQINNARDSAQSLLDSSLPASSNTHQRSALNSIYRDATAAIRVLDDFISLDALDQGTLQLNIHPDRLDLLLAERLTLITRTVWGKSLRIRRILGEVTCPLDLQYMGKIIDKLLINAIQSTPPGKDVVVRVGKTENEAVLAVINQGSGIPPEDRPHLFKSPYVARTGVKLNGAGLHLFLVAQLVAAHKGRIWAESRLDQETAFYVALPLANDACASTGINCSA